MPAETTAPQVFVTTLWHAGFALPWDFRTGPGTDSERCHLDQMLDGLPEKTFLLADAGFVSFGLCHALQQQGHSFLLRVGSNVHLLTDLEYEYEQRDDIVYLWPRKQRRLPPLKLRLIRLPDEKGQTVYLLTDILDTQRLPDKRRSGCMHCAGESRCFTDHRNRRFSVAVCSAALRKRVWPKPRGASWEFGCWA